MKKLIFKLSIGLVIIIQAGCAQPIARRAPIIIATNPSGKSFSERSGGQSTFSKKEIKLAKAGARAASHLNDRYKNLRNINWSAGNDYLLATFEKEKIKYHVYYTTGGRWLQEIQFMFPTELPAFVTGDLIKEYPAYKILYGVRIRESNKTCFIITLEGTSDYIHVTFLDGEIFTIRSIEKANE